RRRQRALRDAQRRRRRRTAGDDLDRELPLRLRWTTPGGRGRILIAEVDPARPASGLARDATDQAARRHRESRRQRAVDEAVLVRQRGTAAAGAVELLAVGLANDAGRHVVAVVREPDRQSRRDNDECDERD